MTLQHRAGRPHRRRADPRGRDLPAARATCRIRRSARPTPSGWSIERQRRSRARRTACSGTASAANTKLYEEFFELTDIETQFAPVFERYLREPRSTAPAGSAARGAACRQSRKTSEPWMPARRRASPRCDFDAATSLALELDFDGPQPAALRRARAPPARRFVVGRLQWRGGARRQLQLPQHHADSPLQRHAHRERRPPDDWRICRCIASCRSGRLPALLLTVDAVATRRRQRRRQPTRTAARGPSCVTRRALAAALADSSCPSRRGRCCCAPRGRTAPADEPALPRRARPQRKSSRAASNTWCSTCPLPIAASDEGRLTAHRLFFGLPPAATGRAAMPRAAIARSPNSRSFPARIDGRPLRAACCSCPPSPAMPCRAARSTCRWAAMSLDDAVPRRARRMTLPIRCAASATAFAIAAGRDGRPLVYLCGHSLGLAPLAARGVVERGTRRLGAARACSATTQARRPWIDYAELLQAGLARLTGARQPKSSR